MNFNRKSEITTNTQTHKTAGVAHSKTKNTRTLVHSYTRGIAEMGRKKELHSNLLHSMNPNLLEKENGGSEESTGKIRYKDAQSRQKPNV